MDIEGFIQTEKRIDAAVERQSEAEALHADAVSEELRGRWESGQQMLAERVGKRLPNNLLAELVEATGKSQSELKYRMQFAERYPTEEKLATAVASFSSWRQVRSSLPKREDDKPKPPPTPPPAAPKADRPDVVEKINEFEDRGENYSAKDVVEAVGGGLSADTVERSRKAVRAAREAVAEATPVQWDSIPGNQQAKLERAKTTQRRELEREYRTRLLAEIDQYRAKLDADFAAYKERYDAENERFKALRDEERKRYQMGIEVQRAKGLITPGEYETIRSCLHPDSRLSASDEKLATAFRLFNDEKIKILLVKEQ